MRKKNTEEKPIIVPENYKEDIFELMNKGDIEESDGPLRYPLYFEPIQSAFISFFQNHERLVSEREKTEKHIYDFKSPDNVNNIIAFLGKRGSGKTTAINEFGRILTYIEEKKMGDWWKEHLRAFIGEQSVEDFQFIVLDSIDASLLTASEDIVELVLAQMYAKIENKFQNNRRDNEGYNIADTINCFRRAYQNYHNLSRGVPEKELGDSVPNILKNIPSGSNVRRAFTDLLIHFFQHMGLNKERPHYLVITIDDLDLNIEYGYQLLEKIRKYLSDPRILVLITADFNQLSRLCEVYWLNQYGKENTVRIYCDNRQYYGAGRFFTNGQAERYNEDEDYGSSKYHENASQLSRDYLLKAIPITHRVYLSGKKDIENVRIYENKEKILLKKYIWKKLVEKLGIFYDLKGTKRHFVMPDSVREFVTYNNFLDSLDSLTIWEESGKEAKFFQENMSKYDWNHYRMNEDITNRMAHSLLSDMQKKEFDRLVNQNILNRAKYAVDLFENWSRRETKDRTDKGIYRYSDLLEGIYQLGRENYHDKKLVHCIMAYFTSEMTREYFSFLLLKEKEKTEEKMEKMGKEQEKIEKEKERVEKTKAEKNLRHFLGTSFGNEWLGEILPAIHISREDGIIEKRGFVKEAQLSAWSLEGEITKNEETWNVELISVNLRESLKKKKSIEIFGLCMMLFSRFKKAGTTVAIPKAEFKIKNIGKKEETESEKSGAAGTEKPLDKMGEINLQEKCLGYELSFSVDTADFDVFGFIGKKWDEKEIDEFSENIMQSITDEIVRVTKGKEQNDAYKYKVKRNVVARLKDLVNQQLKVFMRNNELIFPFYNLDLSYNVLKRARNIGMERGGIVETRDIYAAMRRAYGYIAMELYEEDRLYDQYGITRHEIPLGFDTHEKWSMRFVKSPFITRFGISYPEEILEKYKEEWKKSEEYCFDEFGGAENQNYRESLEKMLFSFSIPDVKESPDDIEGKRLWKYV